MTVDDLSRAWPEYWESHDLWDTELERIASVAADVFEAGKIWENETWWADPLPPKYVWVIKCNKLLQQAYARKAEANAR